MMAGEGVSPSLQPSEALRVLEYRVSVRRWEQQSTALTVFGALRVLREGGSPIEAFPHLFREEMPKKEDPDGGALAAQLQQIAILKRMARERRRWQTRRSH